MGLLSPIRNFFRPTKRKTLLTRDVAVGLKARQQKAVSPKERIPRRINWSVGEYGTINKANFRAIYLMKKSHPWLRACLRATEKQVIKSGWDVIPKNKDEPWNEETRKRIKLFLENCNPQTTFSDLVVEWFEDKATYGDGFLEIVLNEMTGEPASLWSIMAETMRVLANDHGEIMAYPQIVDGSLASTFEPKEILHWKEGSDDYSLFGMGRLESLLGAIAVDLMADDHNRLLLEENNGRVPGYLVFEDSNQDELERLRDSIITQTAANPWAPVYLSGKVSQWIPTALTEKDINFTELKKEVRNKIMAVYGVTPMKVSIVETGKLANPEEQIEVANDTVRAEQQEAESVLNMKLIPLFKNSENLKFTFNPVEEKIDDQLKLKDMELKQAQIDEIYLRNKVMTINEVREKRSFGNPVTWGQEPVAPDVPQLPFSLSQAQLTKAVQLQQKRVDKNAIAFYRALSEVNKKAMNETLALIKEEKSLSKKIGEGINANLFSVFAKSLGRYGIIIRQFVDKEFKKSIDNVSEQLNTKISEKDFSNTIKALVEENMKGYLDLNGNWYPGIKGVNEELEKEIKSALQKAIEEELGVSQAQELLKERFAANDSRLQAIARTELNRAANKGAILGYKKSGVVKAKKWLAAKPRREQDSQVCTSLDGQEQELDEPFTDSHTGQKFSAPPAHPNCRSTVVPIIR